MKSIFVPLAAIVLIAAPAPCFALWEIAAVSKEVAKDLGLEIRTTATAPNHIIFELEFASDGKLKGFSSVDLRIGQGDNPPITAALREDRTKPGRVVVSFTADRGQLDKLSLWVMIPGSLGGMIYDIRVKDFVEAKKDR